MEEPLGAGSAPRPPREEPLAAVPVEELARDSVLDPPVAEVAIQRHVGYRVPHGSRSEPFGTKFVLAEGYRNGQHVSWTFICNLNKRCRQMQYIPQHGLQI